MREGRSSRTDTSGKILKLRIGRGGRWCLSVDFSIGEDSRAAGVLLTDADRNGCE